jgi:hypothetical protein
MERRDSLEAVQVAKKEERERLRTQSTTSGC